MPASFTFVAALPVPPGRTVALPSATTPRTNPVSNAVEYVAKSNPAAVVTVAQPTSSRPTGVPTPTDVFVSSPLSSGTVKFPNDTRPLTPVAPRLRAPPAAAVARKLAVVVWLKPAFLASRV